ncbi:MAG: ATPase, partial [Chloroflexia bacterium]
IAGGEKPYVLPEHRNDYGGIVISLSKQAEPDTSAYNDPEIAWRLYLDHHVGFVVASPEQDRVKELIDSYIPRIYEDFYASQPALEKPAS